MAAGRLARPEAATFLKLAVALLLGLPALGAKGRPERIQNGLWGGEHVRMTVKDAGAAVEFDCAHGTIDTPLALDDDQHFDAQGVFVREHGGPIRINETESREPAHYQGSRDGSTLTLRIVLESGKTVGPFTLAFGQNGRVRKCG
jgi:hypothetical protein